MDIVGGLSMWHLIVIVVGSVIFLFILLILCYCCKFKSKAKRSDKERKRYVYKYDPFTGKGNVAVIMEMSTSNGGIVSVEQPEVTDRTIIEPVGLKKDLQIERPRSQSFTETRFVYRYNPASGEGSVEQIPAVDSLAPKKPKSSRSHNCLTVDLLENQMVRKRSDKTLPVTLLQKLNNMETDSKGGHEAGSGRSDIKATRANGRTECEVRAMKTRVGKKKGFHHVLLSADNTKPSNGKAPVHGTVSDCSGSNSPTATELSRSTSELLKLHYGAEDNPRSGSNVGHRRKNSTQNRPRASVGDIFPPSSRSRRKSSSRLGLLLNNHARASESHIFGHRRKHSDSASLSAEGEDDFTYRTLSLTSLTQSMWQKEYETAAHDTSEAFIPEVKELPELADIEDDSQDDVQTTAPSQSIQADVHLIVPETAFNSTQDHAEILIKVPEPPAYNSLYW